KVAAEQLLRAHRLQRLAVQHSAEALIGTHGWMVQGVFGSPHTTPPKPTHAYTIGLQERFQHPEFVLVGLSIPAAQTLLNELARRVESGKRYADGGVVSDIGNLPVTLRAVHHSREPYWLGRGLEHAAAHGVAHYDALQLVWPDPDGHLPWQLGYNEH